MKTLIDILFGSIRWLILAVGGIISAWVWFETYFDAKVQASEVRVIERMVTIRNGDMALIDTELKAIKEDTALIKSHLLGVGKPK